MDTKIADNYTILQNVLAAKALEKMANKENLDGGNKQGEMAVKLSKLLWTIATSHEPLSKEYLMDQLDYPGSTLEKHLKIIRTKIFHEDSGYSLETKRNGKKGYYFIKGNPFIKDDIFKLASVYTGLMLLKSMEGTTLEEGAQETFEEIMCDKKIFKSELQTQFERKICCSGFARKDYSEKEKIIRIILEALIYNKRVKIYYLAVGKENLKTHSLCPYTLYLHKDALYLYASRDANENIRTFAVERIESAEVLKDEFKYPMESRYNPDNIADGAFGIYEIKNRKSIDIEVEFHEELHGYITKRHWHRTESFSEIGNGRFTMNLTLNNLKEFRPWIMQFGSKAKVIQPKSLKNEIKEEFQKALELY